MFMFEEKVNHYNLFKLIIQLNIFYLDLPVIEHASIHLSAKTIHYRLNNASFATLKVPLCLRIDINNHTNICSRVVTSSGFFSLDENDLRNIQNVSLCLDHYEDYCSKSVPVAFSKNSTSTSVVFVNVFILLQNKMHRSVGYLF